MDVVCIGGGPAGLYLALLLKQHGLAARVRVFERNRPDDTFGFGVVFSDRTLSNLMQADPTSHQEIVDAFVHWDDIDVHYQGQVISSTGHGFSGMSRMRLLKILQRRAEALGVELCFEAPVEDLTAFSSADLVVIADGVNSQLRELHAEAFQPRVDMRPNRFVWLGTSVPFKAFTFYFKESEHGLFRVHAYRYEEAGSTFIVECTEETFERAGFEAMSEQGTVAYFERLFADELAGHPLLTNRSIWRQFPTVSNRRWWTALPSGPRLVLLGDALHTAHFSIGSGTKLALEDAISLMQHLQQHGAGEADGASGSSSAKLTLSGAVGETPGVATESSGELSLVGRRAALDQALTAFEAARRPEVASVQRAAEVSLRWFEQTERYLGLSPLQFTFSLLTRSLRVSHGNLKLRDPALVSAVDHFVAAEAEGHTGLAVSRGTPPMFTPLTIRGVTLTNRVGVSPMCQYSAQEGLIDDWHLVHLGSRAVGGAGLIVCEMTAISPEARITPGCAGLYTEAHEAAWRRVVEFTHRHSEAKIGIQLGHAGRKGATDVPWRGERPLTEGAWPLVAASPIAYDAGSQVPRELSRAEMEQLLMDYRAATRRAAQAGFDLLEVHMAHGYLLASFISPLTNRRTDGYGGSMEARARFPLEVLRAVREEWPEERPLSVRISASDWYPEGLSEAEVVCLAELLGQSGADIIDVSTGQTLPEARPAYGRLYQTPFSELVRLSSGILTMTVGNISSFSDVNSIIAGGRADVCLLARGHLFDPYFTQHAARAQDHEVSLPPQYASVANYRARAD